MDWKSIVVKEERDDETEGENKTRLLPINHASSNVDNDGSFKRKLDADILMRDMMPSSISFQVYNDDDEDAYVDDDEVAILNSESKTMEQTFLRFFATLDDDDEEDDEVDDGNDRESIMSKLGHLELESQAGDKHSPQLKSEDLGLPIISPPSSNNSPAIHRADDYHPIFLAKDEIDALTRRVSTLYETLRHSRCQVQVHSLEELDLSVQGPQEHPEPRIPVLQFTFIERVLAVAHTPEDDTGVLDDNDNADDEDNVFSDSKPVARKYAPCVRGDRCVGVSDQWASLCGISVGPSSSGVLRAFPGARLRALVYPEELGNDNEHLLKSRLRPCFFCILKEVHETWITFAVNRLSVYESTTAPIQCFGNAHGPDEFDRSLLLMPGTHAYNGLVQPILGYHHNRFIWDFDPYTRRWRVAMTTLKSATSQSGVTMGSTRTMTKPTSKKPLN